MFADKELLKKIKFLFVKDVPINLDKLQFEETIIAMADAFKKKFNVDEKAKQTSLDEIAGGKIAVKPKKK